MKITRISKSIYTINGTRIDTRKRISAVKYHGVRQALFLYYVAKNKNLTHIQIDSFVCKIMNKKTWELWNAVENGEATI